MNAARPTPLDSLWQLLLALRWRIDAGHSAPLEMGAANGEAWIFDGTTLGPAEARALSSEESNLLALFLPIAAASGSGLVVAQLGQSLDGSIATAAGDSHYVTGPESLVHLHRLRALCDAVVVGGATVEADDPRLTTRHVAGPCPTRVVLDREGRLPADRAMFTERKGAAIRIVASEQPEIDGVDTLLLPSSDQRFDPASLRAALLQRGFRRILVEGGGRLVTAWMQAGTLDRLHLVVAPVFLGTGARRGVNLPAIDDLAAAQRPKATSYHLGQDVLFDLDLGASRTDG